MYTRDHLFSCSSSSPSSLPLILPRRKFCSSAARGRTMLAGVGGVESNFMLLTTPCVTSHDHPDLPAILVYIECLCALEVTNLLLLLCCHCFAMRTWLWCKGTKFKCLVYIIANVCEYKILCFGANPQKYKTLVPAKKNFFFP